MTVSPAVLIALGTLIITLAGVVATLAIKIHKGENASEAAKTAKECADKVAADLAGYKVEVAEKYVSTARMDAFERRMELMVKGLGDRLERLFHPAHPHG